MKTLSQRTANAMWPGPKPVIDNRTDRELAIEAGMALRGIRRKQAPTPQPPNPYQRKSVSPLGGQAAIGSTGKKLLGQ